MSVTNLMLNSNIRCIEINAFNFDDNGLGVE